MNLNEECLLKYLQNPDELVDLTSLLLEFSGITPVMLADGLDYGKI